MGASREFDTREQMVRALLPAGGAVAEIGVFEGSFSRTLLATGPATLHLVDPWAGRVVSGDADGNDLRSVHLPDALEALCREHGGDPRVRFFRGTSAAFFARAPRASLDAVYLDGDHSYEGVAADLAAAWPALRPGGWLMGHDYDTNPDRARVTHAFGVKRAVDEFLAARGLRVAALAADGCVSFAVRKPPRRAVFYVAGGDPGYAALLRESVASLRRFHPPEEVEVLVACDAAYAPHAADAADRVVVTPPNRDGQAASMRKVRVAEWLAGGAAGAGVAFAGAAGDGRGDGWDAVLYLDCDVVVDAPLDGAFEVVRRDGVLYACREAGPEGHAREYWSLGGAEGPARDAAVGDCFNAGQFGFVPGPATRAHLAAVAERMRTHRGPYFWEQSFLNHHFGVLRPECLDTAGLTPHVLLAARERDDSAPRRAIAHFSDATLPWRDKLALMRRWAGRGRG